ncbi:putative necrosis-inducing factor-domain-containing protein [Cercophora samala]|uniref:Necrosis-inducing factor-domain-containing protein n=1 Tax=Cercophora samala TaxID=330535 RepID=A0AA39ZB60_9PEZI|nr:putative necrosis-inducing factor-domain-containing protein [Cercophora samala]
MQVLKQLLAFGGLSTTTVCALNAYTPVSEFETTLATSVVSYELSTVSTTLPSATDVYTGTVTDNTGDSTSLIKPRPTTDGGGPLDTVYACGDTTVIDQFSYGSPLVSDCWDVYNGLEGKTYPWILDHMWAQRAFASSGTCVIGAQIVSQTDYPSYVGSEDFRIAIKKSIEQFAKKDDKGRELVGTKGYMQCGRSLDPQVTTHT